eukprot:gene19799-23480_t
MADTCPPISAALGDHRHYNDMRPASDSTTASPQQPEQTSHYLHEAQNDNNEPEQGDKLVIDSGDDSAQQPPITEAEANDGDDGSESDAANGEENEDDDDADDDDRALLADVPVAVQNRTMERCFKRVMMHTRVQEALLLRKYQVGKVLKDVKLSYPKLSTYAEVPTGAATGRMSQKRRLMKKLSSQQAQLQLGLPMGALDMVKSFFYVDYDWLERCLYATAKCDDWASLLQCYHK